MSNYSSIVQHLEEEGFGEFDNQDEYIQICEKTIGGFKISVMIGLYIYHGYNTGNIRGWINGYSNKKAFNPGIKETLWFVKMPNLIDHSEAVIIFENFLKELYQIVDIFNAVVKHKISVHFEYIVIEGEFSHTRIACDNCEAPILTMTRDGRVYLGNIDLIDLEDISNYNDKEYVDFIGRAKACGCNFVKSSGDQ